MFPFLTHIYVSEDLKSNIKNTYKTELITLLKGSIRMHVQLGQIRHLLFTLCVQDVKTLMRLCGYAGLSGFSLVA